MNSKQHFFKNLGIGVLSTLIAYAIISLAQTFLFQQWQQRYFTNICIAAGIGGIIASFFWYSKLKKLEIKRRLKPMILFSFGILIFLIGVFNITDSREPFDLSGGIVWPVQGGLHVQNEGRILVFSGSLDNRRTAGYVIESSNLGLDQKQRLILDVSGIIASDRFDLNKLLKLEINDHALTAMGSSKSMNINDPNFLNAQNGRYVFDISNIEYIRKINLVFYNSSIGNVKIAMFIR